MWRLRICLSSAVEIEPFRDAGGQPGRQLAVPDQRVTVDALVVRARVSHERVALCEVVDAPLRLDRLPFHDVLRGHAAELAIEHAAVLRVVREGVHVDGAAHEDAAEASDVTEAEVRPVVRARRRRRGEQGEDGQPHGHAAAHPAKAGAMHLH
jgi:hypothetical protein